MSDYSLTIPDGAVEAIEDPFAEAPPSSVDGDICPVCGKGPFKRLNAHITKSHSDGGPEKLSVTRQVQKDVAGRGAPTVDQLTKTGGRLLGYGSVALASIMVDDDPRPLTETDKDAIVDALSATPAEANDIMRPLARIFAGTTLNKRVGRKVVDNMDAADSLIALYMMSRRWSQYLAERKAYSKANENPAPAVVQPQPRVDMNVMQQRIAQQDALSGVVVTPDMVMAMRGGR